MHIATKTAAAPPIAILGNHFFMEELHINASPLRCTIRDDTSSAWSSSLSQYGHPRIGLTAGGGLPPRHAATDCERLAGDGSFEIVDGQ
jgi:hypothetical protein